ncbi:MAG: TadE family protein [Eubacterium sp.]
MKRQFSGQITVEISIVFPIVMMVTASLIYFSLYVHDVTTIKSFTYSAGIENMEKDSDCFKMTVKEEIKKIPTFILKSEIWCEDQNTCFNIKIKSNSSKYIRWLENLTGSDQNNQTIRIEKKISKEILYGCRAICDQLGERRTE